MPTLSPTIDRARLHALHERERQSFRDRNRESAALAREAGAHLLSGVPMPWMTRWPGDHPLFFTGAQGAHFRDADGHDFIDFCLGDTGAMTGHGLSVVADALSAQARRGITTMLPSGDAAWVAAELHRRFGMARWQFAMTATDANRFVLRLARQLTGRRKVLVFDYSYHGTVDESLVTVDAAGHVIPRPGNLGWAVPPAEIARVAQFNDLDSVEAQLRQGDVAAVLTEPALTNIGIVPPDEGFLAGLRALCTRYGAYLVIDETHTICLGPGGATREWGLEPDFFVIGKPIGGGMPAAAYAMTQPIADALDSFLRSDDVDVSGLGGTLTGNALALAAMRATLANALREEDFALTIPLAARWAQGVQATIDRHGLGWSVQQLGSRAEYWFCPPPRNGAQAAAAIDADLDAFMHLYALNRGILLTPFHNMALLSPFHTEADVDRHSEVFAAAVAEVLG
ncbi:transaminase [Deinococcus koreensis]|uniref:Aspartate aminotransferase family protein n=1 Tax=Deinococcus koreensis TaxID=2054903 RepID=A0A2K3UZE8_9DEIO|nr:transaminase [Deinococcus koreensis]PNY81895.1 aspartate aminotransferase family protein [Deinococcus koreensis]